MFVTALLTAAVAAPVPKAMAPALYFPVVEGTKRVMQTKPGGREATETVSKVTEKDGTYTVTVTVTVESTGRTDEVRYEVSAKGVFALTLPGTEKGEPAALLKLPAMEGETWTTERTVRGKGTVTTYTVGKEEEVTVPAGKYKAIPVTAAVDLGGTSLTTTTWYAIGVGVVMSVNESRRSRPRQELTEFSPGKAK